MNVVDIIVVTLLLAGTVVGLLWGSVREMAALLGLGVALFIAGRSYEPLAQWLTWSGIIVYLNWARLASFVGITLLVWGVLALGAAAIKVFLRAPALGTLDKMAGAAIGFALALAMAMSFVIVTITYPVPGLTQDAKDSRVAHAFSGVVPFVLVLMPPEFDAVQTTASRYPR